jgi:hypothetical protein
VQCADPVTGSSARARPAGGRGHDDTARAGAGKPGDVRRQRGDLRLAGQHHQVVIGAAAGPHRGRPAQASQQVRRRRRGRGRPGREVQRDHRAGAAGGQRAAGGLEADRLGRPGEPGLVQHVRAGQGGVPAQRDLGGRGEPAQPVAAVARLGERCLGQVHLGGHRLHPGGFCRAGEQAHRRRIAAERLAGERIHLEYAHAGSIRSGPGSVSGPQAGLALAALAALAGRRAYAAGLAAFSRKAESVSGLPRGRER